MRLVFFFLLTLFACRGPEIRQFSSVQIQDTVLENQVRKFLDTSKGYGEGNDFLIISQRMSDTTVFYLLAGVKPDFTCSQILGCFYVNENLVWLQGEKPDEYFVTINNSRTEKPAIVDAIKETGVIVNGHPLQWMIEFKGNVLIGCTSNNGESCW